MWAIIYTVCTIPLVGSLMWSSHKARKAGALDDYKSPYQLHGGKRLVSALFWQLDVPGIILLIAVFGCILTVSVNFQTCYFVVTDASSPSPSQAAPRRNGRLRKSSPHS